MSIFMKIAHNGNGFLLEWKNSLTDTITNSFNDDQPGGFSPKAMHIIYIRHTTNIFTLYEVVEVVKCPEKERR